MGPIGRMGQIGQIGQMGRIRPTEVNYEVLLIMNYYQCVKFLTLSKVISCPFN